MTLSCCYSALCSCRVWDSALGGHVLFLPFLKAAVPLESTDSYFLALSDSGTTVFAEGDRICFCYVILQGSVSFTQINQQSKRNEEIGVRFTGEENPPQVACYPPPCHGSLTHPLC